MDIVDVQEQLKEILAQDSVEIAVEGGKTLISTEDLISVITVGAWEINDRGYVLRRVSSDFGGQLYLHNYITGHKYVDHKNGNLLDNRRENLRPANHSQNAANRRVPAHNRTGYKGVVETPNGRFTAQVFKEGRRYSPGTFDTKEEAALAYDDKAVKLFGEYAATNFPREGHRWAREHLADTH